MILAEVIDRLTALAPALAAVEAAEDEEAVVKGVARADGTAFVMPWREIAQANPWSSGAFRQLVEVQFVVACVVRHHDDRTGGKRVLRSDSLRAAVETALAGWQPASAERPIELIGSTITALKDNVSLLAQTWRTARFLTGAT